MSKICAPNSWASSTAYYIGGTYKYGCDEIQTLWFTKQSIVVNGSLLVCVPIHQEWSCSAQESKDCMNTMHALPWLPLGHSFVSFLTRIGSLLDCDLIANHVTCYWCGKGCGLGTTIETCIDFYQHLFCVLPQVVQISSTGETEYFWAIHALMLLLKPVYGRSWGSMREFP